MLHQVNIFISCLNQQSLLACINKIFRFAKSVAGACFHLGKYNKLVLIGNYINFGFAMCPVFIKYLISGAFKVSLCHTFAPATKFKVFGHYLMITEPK